MIENAVRVLNELLAADPKATGEFFQLGVTVNREVCDHPTIQVRGEPDSAEGVLRPLGLLNGLFQEGGRVIVMHTDPETTTIVGFSIGILDESGTVTPEEEPS